jgi:hypothetical protein
MCESDKITKKKIISVWLGSAILVMGLFIASFILWWSFQDSQSESNKPDYIDRMTKIGKIHVRSCRTTDVVAPLLKFHLPEEGKTCIYIETDQQRSGLSCWDTKTEE